ncbi:MAG: hypothetical protein KBF57_02300 [Saprospiraceae bacterium]|nr:hypothetical protein [Saprospiraceae bacterium]
MQNNQLVLGTFLGKSSMVFWILVYVILVYFSLDHIFFWDTVQLASKQAHHFYEGNMYNFLLPDAIDSGHLPFKGWMLAWVWKIMGKTLLISHLVMVPWLVLLIVQVHFFANKVVSDSWAPILASLLLLDPTLMAQGSLISPDVILMGGFFLALNGIWSKQRKLIFSGAILCILASNRGAMVVGALLVWQFYLNWTDGRKHLGSYLSNLWPYLPAGCLFLTFQIYHYWSKGWIGYHDQSPWAASFAGVTGLQFLKNMAIMGWRLMDFGRWFLGLIVFIGLLKWRHRLSKDEILIKLFFLLVFLSFFLLPSMVLHTGLTGHRYLLPLIVTLLVITVRMVFLLQNGRFQILTIVLLGLSLITGNYWIYPKGVAQGWDASLAHWPYFELRSQMNQYLEQHQISIRDVGCSFPNLAEKKYLDLSQSSISHANKDLLHNYYFLYSNLYNDISSEDFRLLECDYKTIHTLEKNGVCLILYQRKKRGSVK